MEKVKILQEKALALRVLLQMHEKGNADATLLLRLLTPLFEDIARGNVIPPVYYQHGLALGKDNPLYEPGSWLFRAESDFVAALEDWTSQPWYQDGSKHTTE